VVLFVAGKKSSNGKVLYDIAREENPRTYFIEDSNDIDPRWLDGAGSVGISGATSTPHWLMNEVKEWVETHAATSTETSTIKATTKTTIPSPIE
jgi:4-hydroxy-3-methylbut-2-enyl diphosphate reductase